MRTHLDKSTGIVALWIGILVCVGSLVSLAGPDGDETDGDLVPDGFDNCLFIKNGPFDACDQTDDDQDGYGNSCDADYDQTGSVGLADFAILAGSYLLSSADPGFVGEADCDCTGTIGLSDFTCMPPSYLSVPGPSGLGCANIQGFPCP